MLFVVSPSQPSRVRAAVSSSEILVKIIAQRPLIGPLMPAPPSSVGVSSHWHGATAPPPLGPRPACRQRSIGHPPHRRVERVSLSPSAPTPPPRPSAPRRAPSGTDRWNRYPTPARHALPLPRRRQRPATPRLDLTPAPPPPGPSGPGCCGLLAVADRSQALEVGRLGVGGREAPRGAISHSRICERDSLTAE